MCKAIAAKMVALMLGAPRGATPRGGDVEAILTGDVALTSMMADGKPAPRTPNLSRAILRWALILAAILAAISTTTTSEGTKPHAAESFALGERSPDGSAKSFGRHT